MPELPEVETTRRGIAPYLSGAASILSQSASRGCAGRYRLPCGKTFRANALRRSNGAQSTCSCIPNRVVRCCTLGMSGSLRVLAGDAPAGPHDHVDWRLDSGRLLRFTDPRRFGCQLWQPRDTVHRLLAALGPEPLGDGFDGAHLWKGLAWPRRAGQDVPDGPEDRRRRRQHLRRRGAVRRRCAAESPGW
jgi:formamidopyrimidine-DNA glycosylase